MREVLMFLAGAFCMLITVLFYWMISRSSGQERPFTTPPPTDWDRYERMKSKSNPPHEQS